MVVKSSLTTTSCIHRNCLPPWSLSARIHEWTIYIVTAVKLAQNLCRVEFICAESSSSWSNSKVGCKRIVFFRMTLISSDWLVRKKPENWGSVFLGFVFFYRHSKTDKSFWLTISVKMRSAVCQGRIRMTQVCHSPHLSSGPWLAKREMHHIAPNHYLGAMSPACATDDLDNPAINSEGF